MDNTNTDHQPFDPENDEAIRLINRLQSLAGKRLGIGSDDYWEVVTLLAKIESRVV